MMEGPNCIIVEKTCTYTQQKVKKMVEVVQALKRKIDSFEFFVKTKDCAIKDVRARITLMCNALRKAREISDFSKEK
jgi:hypothetical protein